MRYQMKLNSGEFLRIKTGEKTLEYRLCDEKRKMFKIGDEIEFLKLPYLDEKVLTKIENLHIYQNWKACYSDFFKEDLKKFYKNIAEVVEDTYNNLYSKEEEEKYGCMAIRIKKVKDAI